MAGQLDTTRAGIAAFEDGDSFTDVPLFTGERRVYTDSGTFAADQTVAALTVLAYDASSNLVPCVNGAGDSTATPVAIAMVAVDTTDGSTKPAPCYWSGCFNPDRLVWDDSFDTEAKKMAAFGVPSTSNIAVKKMR